VSSGSIYRLGDLALASRLSFFLWSSLPDESLLQAAEQGKLKQPAVLEQQIRRMLADPRSKDAHRQLRRAVAAPAQPEELESRSRRVPGLRRQPPAGDEGRDGAVLRRASCARTAA
jgi:hypothetical protein